MVVSRHLASNWTRRDTLFSSHSFHHNTKAQHPHSGATASTLHHSHTINPEYDTRRFLGPMPAIQRYKNRPQRAIIHEGTGLNVVGCWRSQSLIADFSTTVGPIWDPLVGRLLGSTPATQWYKGRLCRIRGHEIVDLCESCLYR